MLFRSLVGQTFKAGADNLSGISIMFATYSGRENTDLVNFYLRRSIKDSADLRIGTVQPQTLGDNQFYRFEFEPVTDSAGQTYFFFVVSPSSSPGNAITIDLDGRDPYPLGSAYVVRGQGLAVTDPQVLARSGKPSLDVGFEAYYSVPLGVATVNKVITTGQRFVQTWDEQRASYIVVGKIAAIALLLLVFLIAFVTLPKLPANWILGT